MSELHSPEESCFQPSAEKGSQTARVHALPKMSLVLQRVALELFQWKQMHASRDSRTHGVVLSFEAHVSICTYDRRDYTYPALKAYCVAYAICLQYNVRVAAPISTSGSNCKGSETFSRLYGKIELLDK